MFTEILLFEESPERNVVTVSLAVTKIGKVRQINCQALVPVE